VNNQRGIFNLSGKFSEHSRINYPAFACEPIDLEEPSKEASVKGEMVKRELRIYICNFEPDEVPFDVDH
jgi:hypothetical protein